MKFGVAVTTSVSPAVTASAQADYVRRLAPAVEEAGYDSIWVSDRTVFPADLPERYPDMYGPGRSNPDAQNVLEALTTLTFVAGMTQTARLGISVLVLPFRDPVLNAKMITTLDVLSGGRVIFGIGVGWMPEEFEAMGASYADRGALTDEHIEMFKSLCSEDVAEFQGEHFQTSGMVFFPRPTQRPHPPIWVGGNTRRALRRAARVGDAWHGIRLTPGELAAKRETLRRLCKEHDREESSVEVSLRANVRIGETQYSDTGDRTPLTGTVDDLVDDLRRYEEAGLEYLVLSVAARDTDSTIEGLHRFADEIAPRV
jgi:probable F420-dependent oxidoreductase